MDEFWQSYLALGAAAIAIPFIGLLIWYLVIRLAVMHALRDHVRWLDKRRERAARTSYPNAQAYPPITPEPHDPL